MIGSFCTYGNCVDVVLCEDGTAVVSGTSQDGTLVFTREEWRAFVQAVKNDEFDV